MSDELKIRKPIIEKHKVLDVLLPNPKPSRSVIYAFAKEKFPYLSKRKLQALTKVVEGALWEQPEKILHAICELIDSI